MSNPLFRRYIKASNYNLIFTNAELDMEFDIPFDDDLEPNLATLTIYNLSKATVSQLKRGQPFIIQAGYINDSGVVFKGEIANVYSSWNGADRITTLKLLDSVPYNAKKVVNVTYKKNVKAETIIRDLAKRIGLKIAALRLLSNKVYKNGHTVDGEALQALQSIAVDCGASCYISRGQTYIRPIKDGEDHNFKLNVNTGLIGSPDFFESERNGKTEKGYNLTSLLQYRMNTAGIIYVESREVGAVMRIRKGRHICNENDFYTKVEAIL